MKKKQLLTYLHQKGCYLLREGGKHSWWCNPDLNRRSAIPRHAEITNVLAKKICKDLGVIPLK